MQHKMIQTMLYFFTFWIRCLQVKSEEESSSKTQITLGNILKMQLISQILKMCVS